MDKIDLAQTETDKKPDTIWNPMFISLCIVNISVVFGQFMMNTLIPKLADHLGATATVVGVVSGIFAVSALGLKPISGPAIDTFPKKKILTFSILTVMMAYIIYSLSNNITTLIIGRLIQGISMSFSGSVGLALASDALPDDKLTQGISYYTLGQAIASAVGPSLGLALSGRYGYSVAFIVGAAMMAFAALLSIFLKAPPHKKTKKFKITLNSMLAKEALIPTILQFFMSMSHSINNSFLVLYAQKERGIANIGLWFTVNALCLLISRPLVGKLSDRFGAHKTMIPALGMFALSLVITSFANNIYMFLLSAVINAWGYGAAMPINQALCMKCVTPERRGVGGSTFYIGTDIGFFLGPVLAGVIVTNLGYSSMYRFMTIPIVIAAIFFILSLPKIKKIVGLD